MPNNKVLKSLRYILLAIFLIHSTVEAYLHQLLGGGGKDHLYMLCVLMED
ncbi:hypothetical protein CDIOL_15090 [Clostridium diolis]|uniref:Uncharacterized protein n=1 Tax=Clostridium diolis TaxID=223919 RepID=A0AAV3VYL0_9CLOT|nr:hypothetical protein CDIOL_15090 [Clostridium diolis]